MGFQGAVPDRSFKVRRDVDRAGRVEFRLSGTLDESASFDDLLSGLAGSLTFNFRGISHVNSVGLLRLTQFFSKIPDAHPVIVEELAHPIAAQSNLILRLFGRRAEIRSCMAPYSCAACKTQESVVVAAEELDPSRPGPPERRCSTCGEPMLFEEVDEYFDFLCSKRVMAGR